MNTSYYITTPIYYVNDKPHIGHAYTSLACDILARFQRMQGCDVYFLTGTDEHGQKVEKAAQAKNIEPQLFTDEVSQGFRQLVEYFNFSNDDFIRTTEKRHHQSAQALWQKLVEKGDIYLDHYEGWYALRDEAFVTEGETELKDGVRVSKASGAEVQWVKEESYFFKLSAYQDKLLQFYHDHPDFIAPKSRRNEVIRFVEGGLRDLSVSRSGFSWGIPVPGNDKHVMYVWLDALTNYLTALGYPDKDDAKFKTFWPANVHMVGKDILRFHAIYWPAFLMAADIPLPKRIFAHGWWTNEGQKISKSLGNVIDPIALVDEFGLDQVRYFLMREIPFGNDGDFSKASMITRINSDLANELGNLAQRVFSMIAKNCEGQLPALENLTTEDQTLLDLAENTLNDVQKHLDQQAFSHALEAAWELVRSANRYVDEQAPWVLRKENPERMKIVLAVLAETIRHIALYLTPFMPDSCGKILDYLKIEEANRNFAKIGIAGRLPEGLILEKPQAVFPRYQVEG